MTLTTVGTGTDETRRVVEAAYGAFGRRDVAALLALLSPDVEWGEADNPLIPAAGMHHGLPGVMEWLKIGNATEDIRALEVHRVLVEGDMAAVVGRTEIIARPTGRRYAMDFVHVVTVRDGVITRMVEFFDTWLAAEAFRP